jgi:hypothetical protein
MEFHAVENSKDEPLSSGIIISRDMAKQIADHLRGDRNISHLEAQMWADELDHKSLPARLRSVFTQSDDEEIMCILQIVSDWLERQPIAPIKAARRSKDKDADQFRHAWIDDSSIASRHVQRMHDVTLIRKQRYSADYVEEAG